MKYQAEEQIKKDMMRSGRIVADVNVCCSEENKYHFNKVISEPELTS